jgi:septum formation topological specificity factor MinE
MSELQKEILQVLNNHFGDNWKKITLTLDKDPYIKFTYEVVE